MSGMAARRHALFPNIVVLRQVFGATKISMMTSSKGNIFCVTGPLRGESTTGGFPSQRPATMSFDVFFDMRLNKRLNKQCKYRRFVTSRRPLWRQRNDHACWFMSSWWKSLKFYSNFDLYNVLRYTFTRVTTVQMSWHVQNYYLIRYIFA